MEPTKYDSEDAIRDLWKMGVLHWKLHATQKEIYDSFYSNDSQKFIVNAARRTGKSYALCLIAIEFALNNPGARICYAAPQAKAVKKIITPLFRIIMDDCPKELKPKYRTQDQVWEFKNGAEIHIAGTDAERAEALRGQSMHLGICDEAAFMDDLNYVIADILMPQTLTTGGRIIVASTPPKSPAHDFKTYAEEAELKGYYVKKTIYDNPLIKKKTIIKFMMETDPRLTEEEAEAFYLIKGGPRNSTWQREYMAEFIKDENLAVIPEFTEDIMPEIVQSVQRPEFYDGYVSMDVGFNDFTVVLFGYYDFFLGKVVIEDEYVVTRPNTKQIADNIKEKEFNLWGHKKPYLRYSDTDLFVINDLQVMHGVTFIPTQKDNKEAAINKVRLFVKARQLIIHPRCTTLISHLKNAIWNKQRTSFERSDTEGFGHFDAVDALIYLIRNVQMGKNPVPAGHGYNVSSQFISPQKKETHNHSQIKKMFSLRKYFPDWKGD